MSENLLASFTNGNRLGNIADSKQGIATADNNKYLRLWYEVSVENVKFDAKTHEEASLCSENGIHTIKAENLENGMGTMILLLIGIVMEKICVMTEKLYSEIDHFISSHVLVGRL